MAAKNRKTKESTAIDIMEELSNLEQQRQELETKENLLLRDLRAKAGKSFRHEGRLFQIRRRNNRYYLAEMSLEKPDLANLPVAPPESLVEKDEENGDAA